MAVTGFRGDNKRTIIFQNKSGNTPVIEIADGSFSKEAVEEAILTEGIAYIGNRSFAECDQLHQAVLPVSVKEIGDEAFTECLSLKSISLPMQLERIGESAFKGSGLRTLSIPKSVYWIGNHMLAECLELDSISIPENVDRIPDGMFEGCRSLKKVVLSNQLNGIGDRVFFGCSSLDLLIIPDSVSKSDKMHLPVRISSLLFNVPLVLMLRNMPEKIRSSISLCKMSPVMRPCK